MTEYGYILAVGRLVKEKGFDKLIEDLQTTISSIYEKLVIAGDADYQDEYTQKLKEMCKEQKNIRLVGFIKGEKLAQLYTYARIFVLPSTHEGLPIALLEAMSYNCPVLASDIPANKEIGLPEGMLLQKWRFILFATGSEETIGKMLRQNGFLTTCLHITGPI
mgnify:CR=1 FL=1